METKTINISTGQDDIVIHDVVISGETQEERNTRKNPLLPYRSFDYDPFALPGGVFPWHWHDDVECFQMKSGSMCYGIPGREVIFHEGDIAFLNSGVLHTAKRAGQARFLQQNHVFSPDLICSDRNSPLGQKYVMPLLSNRSAGILCVKADAPAAAGLREKMDTAFRAAKEASFGYELTIRSCMTEIWMAFLEIMPPSGDREDYADYSRLTEMLAFIHANYDRRISLEQIAGAAHISTKECERCFRRQIRTLPFDYLMDYRLEKARRFLQGDQFSVTETAMRCGFGSTSYFGSCFRRKYGISPRQYRSGQTEEGR